MKGPTYHDGVELHSEATGKSLKLSVGQTLIDFNIRGTTLVLYKLAGANKYGSRANRGV